MAPLSPTIGVSPKLFVGPRATASFTWTRMPSRLSQKSRPSSPGSKLPLVSTLPSVVSFSITWFGGTRPPVPTTVGSGSKLPLESTFVVGLPESSVVVRLPVVAPPGRNSCTRPRTLTESPTETLGADEVKTKMPSEVAGSASGLGSCM